MSESVYSELPSYRSFNPENDDENYPVVLTPTICTAEEMPVPAALPVPQASPNVNGSESILHPVSEKHSERLSPVRRSTGAADEARNTIGRVTEGSGTRNDPCDTLPHFDIPQTRPRNSVEFSFSPVGTNAMLLLPPLEEHDSRPRYYITVIQNCFMPLSHITTVYRGASENAPRVGEFELGILAGPGYRQMGSRGPESFEDVLVRHGPEKRNGEWAWLTQVGSTALQLFWDCNAVPFVCSTDPPNNIETMDSNSILARFTPRHTKKEVPTGLSCLLVTPNGQVVFDDIVMSILAIQRRILTPYGFATQNLFNYSSFNLKLHPY